MEESLQNLQRIEKKIDDIINSSIYEIPTNNLDQFFLSSIESFMEETKNLETATVDMIQKSINNVESVTNSLNFVPNAIISLKNLVHEQEKEKLLTKKSFSTNSRALTTNDQS